ncbi:MAG: (d)CMP kinase [Lentisphaeria bacterium]|nr:(d)CMP kinase [Lentisphaeria bacterium]
MTLCQVTIDGPAASGKSTVAKLVAQRLGGHYINTGDMYRTVACAVLRRGGDPRNQTEEIAEVLPTLDLGYVLDEGGSLVLMLNGEPVKQEEIRTAEVAAVVSYVARIPAVRYWLRARQRKTVELGTIVMEGRDIGTVILPNASNKFFMTASPEERARRRFAQPGEVPAGATLASVAAEIAERDQMDMNRPVSPLRPAEDAVLIDTDGLTPEQVADRIVDRVEGRA